MAFHKDLISVSSCLSSTQASCSRSSKVIYLMSVHMPMTHRCSSPSMPTPVRSNQQLRVCMLSDRLKLKDDKTEFIITGIRQQLTTVNIDSVSR